jgi:hypothetical protein
MKFFKTFGIVILTIFLIVFFTPLINVLDAKIFGEVGFPGDYGRFFLDFFISCSFFSTIFLTLFGGKRKYVYLAILLGLEFLILFGLWEIWAILIGAAVAAWLIAQAILIIKKKISKK